MGQWKNLLEEFEEHLEENPNKKRMYIFCGIIALFVTFIFLYIIGGFVYLIWSLMYRLPM